MRAGSSFVWGQVNFEIPLDVWEVTGVRLFLRPEIQGGGVQGLGALDQGAGGDGESCVLGTQS